MRIRAKIGQKARPRLMNTRTRCVLAVAITVQLGGCNSMLQPQATAFQRNVGPGSSVSGRPSNDGGRGSPGDELVPGVSVAGPTIGN
jgi:hypothetical protein